MNEDKCLDYEEGKRVLDSAVRRYLLQHGISSISLYSTWKRAKEMRLSGRRNQLTAF